MSKKTAKKASKPLVSALTVANPVEFKPSVPPEQNSPAAPALKDISEARLPAQSPKTVVPPVVTPAPTAVPPPSPSLPKPAAPAPVSLSRTPEAVSTPFVFKAPHAQQVYLCGDFNHWSPEAAPLQHHEDGNWSTTLALQPGRYQYKLIVDGKWMHDPNARENVPNPHGSLNSVIEVRA